MNPPSASDGTTAVFALDAKAADEPRLARFAALLDGVECARAARFVFEKHRRRFIAAHGFLREVLARETGREARALSFELGAQGKPRLVESALHFNLTHTGDHVLLAVSGAELGLDAEEIRAERVDAPLAERVMTASEFDSWSRATREVQVDAFFRLWSAKESVMKATGRGMELSPRSFAVFEPRTLELRSSLALDDRTLNLQALQGPSAISICLCTQAPARITRTDWR